MASKNKDGSDKTMQQLLTEGLTDFIGFAGTFLGFDMAVAGNTSNAGIFSAFALLVCGGLGLKTARYLRKK